MNYKTALTTIVKNPNSFTLLMAPLGWGKTRLLWSLLSTGERILLFSPFRAQVDELQENSKVIKNFDEFMKEDQGIFVSTVEAFDWQKYEQLSDVIVVFDEFHLIYHWGESFRELLIQAYERVLISENRIFALSGTIDSGVLERIERDAGLFEKEVRVINVGNMQIQRKPKKELKLNLDILKKYVLLKAKLFKGRSIVFCRTKREVWNWYEYLTNCGISVSTCIGGGVSRFTLQESVRKSKIIVATSALSHGVNIRNLRHVFITYEPKAYLRKQMEGRGGRFGEGYSVYSLKNEDCRSSVIGKVLEWFQCSFINSILWIYE